MNIPMVNSHQGARRRRLVRRTAVAMAALGMAALAVACAPSPPPVTTPPPPFMDAGCYASGGFGDIQYDGPVNQYHNATYHNSGDGSCSGALLNQLTVVQAADSVAASYACVAANAAYNGVSNLATQFDPPYVGVSGDAWVCSPPSA